jgi:hypothetical protein
MRALLCIALSLALSLAAPVAAAQNYDEMAAFDRALDDAIAQASRPGDERLSCDQLQAEIVATMQDPAVQTAVAENGAQAQQQLDLMNAAQGAMRAQIGVSLFMGLASAFIPGMGYLQPLMEARQERQRQETMERAAQMLERMLPIMPQMMRGQRLYELAQAQQCAFLRQQ